MREGFRQARLISLVESAIKPRARILLVASEYFSLSDFLLNYVSTFELEVESDGKNGLRRYRQRGPYDIVLTGFGRIRCMELQWQQEMIELWLNTPSIPDDSRPGLLEMLRVVREDVENLRFHDEHSPFET